MKRIFRSSLLLLLGVVLGLGILAVVPNETDTNTKSEQPIISENAITTSTSLSTTSSIFSEVANDGLASYLKITIPVAATTDIKTLIIKQTIGNATFTLTTDELNNTCYYNNNNNTKKNVFYFTRPATYNVYYRTSATEVSESCTFAPSLNKTEIEKLYTTPDSGLTKNYIKEANNAYYILNSGDISLSIDSNGLYTLRAESENESADELLTNIPNNVCGNVTYIIEAANKCTQVNLNITIITTKFTTEFYTLDDNTLLSHDDYYFLSTGYCFNEGVKLVTKTDANATDLLGNSLTETETKTIFKYIQFTINAKDRDAQNSQNGIETTTTIPLANEGDNFISYEIQATDHTIYTIAAYLGEKSSNNLYSNNICKFKIITKIPINEQNAYIFSAVLGQGEQEASNNYLEGVFNGYITKNATIYHPSAAVRVFYNGYSTTTTRLKYIYNGTEYTLNKGANKTITSSDRTSQNALIIENGSTIYFENDTASFDSFFIFPITFKGYEIGYSFRNNLIYNRISINGGSIIDMASDTNKIISDPINSLKYDVPDTYEANSIPLHLKVTYNGTVFDDILELSDLDSIEFYDYGNYLLEFYNIDSYDFLATNNYSNQGIYYYSVEFTIAGPSIFAETSESNPVTISNNMYTQKTVNCEVNLNAGQKFIAYKNNEVYTTIENSMSFSLSEIGNWRIDIVDASNNVLKSLSFTIMDTIYQGFSMNVQDEYESLVIYKKISLSPVELEALEESNAYHLLDAGHYRIIMNTKENIPFRLNGEQTSTYTLTQCQIDFEIAKSFFKIEFAVGSNGERITDAIEPTSVDGVQLQLLEVFRNGKLVQTFTADQLANWEAVLTKSFNDNGTYTFRLTDKFGNTYETQIEKYYKVNFALIMLIIILAAAAIALIVIVIKARHRVNVK